MFSKLFKTQVIHLCLLHEGTRVFPCGAVTNPDRPKASALEHRPMDLDQLSHTTVTVLYDPEFAMQQMMGLQMQSTPEEQAPEKQALERPRRPKQAPENEEGRRRTYRSAMQSGRHAAFVEVSATTTEHAT